MESNDTVDKNGKTDAKSGEDIELEIEPAIVPEEENSVEGAAVSKDDAEEEDEDGTPHINRTISVPKSNVFVAARGHVQRVIDVALLISNMSRASTIVKRKKHYASEQYAMLLFALTFSMICQLIAGICFFVGHQREVNQQKSSKVVDYLAYSCVALVMVLNIFISTFDASWTTDEPLPGTQPQPDGT